MSSFQEFDKRSRVPGAVSASNRFKPKVVNKTAVYSGQGLSRFLFDNGGNPFAYRKLLLDSEIGNPFTEITEGTILKVAQDA